MHQPEFPQYAWMDGEFVPWNQARLHVETECVKRGSSVFEGLRGYWNEDREEIYLFRFREHMDRLYDSAKIMRMQPRFTRAELERACIELVIKNGFRTDVAIHPVIYFGMSQGYFGYTPETVYTGAYLTAVARPSALESNVEIAACVSAWARVADRDLPPRIKATANFQNSRLASVQAAVDGYDMAIMLDDRGKVAQAPLASIFLIRGGVPITPSVSNGILEGITRATVLELFREELGATPIEREVDRTELYVADEIFCCGTGHEITPIVSIDRYPVGNGTPGEMTASMRRLYREIVRGRSGRYRDWLHPVYQSAKYEER